MTSLTILATCVLLAPVPDRKPQPTYCIVLAKCISSDIDKGAGVKSELEIVQQLTGGKALVGDRVVIRYLNGDFPGCLSTHSSQLLIRPLRPDNRTYLLVAHTNGRNVAAIDNCDFARRGFMPHLHHLTHPLREKDDGSPTWTFSNFPSEAKTEQLAKVISAVLLTTDSKAREALIQKHHDTANEPLQDYFRWLERRLLEKKKGPR